MLLNKYMSKELVALKCNETKKYGLSVDWYIGRRCNFDCSYCADYVHDSFSSALSFDKIKKFIDKLYKIYGTSIRLSITGGEPVMNPDLIRICRYIKQELNIDEIAIATNGSWPFDYYLELFEYVDHLTISLHFEHILDRLDEYEAKIKKLESFRKSWNKNNKNRPRPKLFLLRYMMLPGNFRQIRDFADKMEKYNIEKVEYRAIRLPYPGHLSQVRRKELRRRIKNNEPGKRYLEASLFPIEQENFSYEEIVKKQKNIYNNAEKEYLEKIYKNRKKKLLTGLFVAKNNIEEEDIYYQDLIYKNKNNFQGWQCWAGTTAIKIDPDGNIYAGSCHVGGILGNINDCDSLSFAKQPLVCDKARCNDIIDLRQSKIKDKKYLYFIKNSIKNKT